MKCPNSKVSVQLITRNMADPNNMGHPVWNMFFQPHSWVSAVAKGAELRDQSAQVKSDMAPAKAMRTA